MLAAGVFIYQRKAAEGEKSEETSFQVVREYKKVKSERCGGSGGGGGGGGGGEGKEELVLECDPNGESNINSPSKAERNR